MKKFLIPLILLFALIAAATFAFFWWNTNSQPISASDEEVRFVIPRGRGASQVGAALEEENLIRSALAFKIYVQVTGNSQKIQSGEYELSPHLSLPEVVKKFLKGPSELWVTVPEGLRREEVVERFVVALNMDATQATTFRQEFLQNSQDLEGFLFPDTYLFPKDVSATKVVDTMQSTFDSKIIPLKHRLLEPDAAGGLNLGEIVTLASIIERETITDEERPIVAGIYFNRLELGMPLQADASAQYAIANLRCRNSIDCDWWVTPTTEDLKVNSSYNTYVRAGLPPAPIASPGLSSLRAIVNPTETDYLYYLHDSDGGIHYAKTLPEHNANVARYIR